MTISLQALEAELKNVGINSDNVCVVGVGGTEQFIGEAEGKPVELVNKRIRLKNPKRFMRLQQVTPKGVAVQFLIGDLDMVEAGFIQVFATYGYYLSNLEVQSQGAMLELLLDFVRRKKAAESPIITPPSGIVLP